jgi:hypothetical protein
MSCSLSRTRASLREGALAVIGSRGAGGAKGGGAGRRWEQWQVGSEPAAADPVVGLARL